MAIEQGEEQKRDVILEETESRLCCIGGHLSSQEFRVRTTISKVQRTSRAPRAHCQRRLKTLTEQGSSALDVIARLPDCAGQAADAVPAYTQVKMEDAPKLLKIPKSECPDVWIRLPRRKWPKSWSSMEDPVVPLERNLCGHPLDGFWWERLFEEVLLELGWEKVFVHRKQGLFLSVYVDVNANRMKSFESRLSAGATEHLPGLEKPHGKTVASSYGMEGHSQSVERFCELAHTKTEQFYKISTLCMDDHNFKEEGSGIRWGVVKSTLTDCFKNLFFGTNW